MKRLQDKRVQRFWLAQVNAMHFFNLPAKVGRAPEGAADYRQYMITITDKKRRYTVRLTDPIEDANLEALLNFINLKAQA